MKAPRRLNFARPVDRLLPPDRGRLWYDIEIPDQFLGGLPGIAKKVRWVRQHLPRATGIKIGRQTAWHESDIRAWLEDRRTQRKSA